MLFKLKFKFPTYLAHFSLRDFLSASSRAVAAGIFATPRCTVILKSKDGAAGYYCFYYYYTTTHTRTVAHIHQQTHTDTHPYTHPVLRFSILACVFVEALIIRAASN